VQAVGVHNGNNTQNHSPHDCATDAVARISLAPRRDNKAKPDTLLTRSANNQLNRCPCSDVDAGSPPLATTTGY
jgi:hypothetical protein